MINLKHVLLLGLVLFFWATDWCPWPIGRELLSTGIAHGSSHNNHSQHHHTPANKHQGTTGGTGHHAAGNGHAHTGKNRSAKRSSGRKTSSHLHDHHTGEHARGYSRHHQVKIKTIPTQTRHHVFKHDTTKVVHYEDHDPGDLVDRKTEGQNQQEESRKSFALAGAEADHEPQVLLALDVDQATVVAAQAEGFQVHHYMRLPRLGLTVAKLAVTSATQEEQLRVWLRAHGVDQVVLNSYYRLDAAQPSAAAATGYPLAMLAWPEIRIASQIKRRLGMVDSYVDVQVPSLAGQRIVRQSFVRGASGSRTDHGTAIASLLVGKKMPGFRGLLPTASLFAAAAFGEDAGSRATVLAIARALDWLVGQDVQVINLSFSGPDNHLLERAVQQVAARQIILIAAAGNEGPNGPTAYPAAYDDVVAVTGVDRFQRPYRQANRGEYIAFAAPGERIPVPGRQDQLAYKSGTSFAAALCTGLAALLLQSEKHRMRKEPLLHVLRQDALDLGPAGQDSIFGWGLVRCGSTCQGLLEGKGEKQR